MKPGPPRGKGPSESLPSRGCLKTFPFAVIPFLLPLIGVWVFGSKDMTPWERVQWSAGLSLLCGLTFFVPMVDLSVRLDIRRFCRKHGLRVLKIKTTKRTYGVSYMDRDEKKYGRWPEDFVRYQGKHGVD